MSEIYYKNTKIKVCLGDYVSTRSWPSLWLKIYRGTVVYVPGQSPRNESMHHDGLSEICVKLDRGGFLSCTIDPEINALVNKFTLLKRNANFIQGLTKNDNPFENEE
jgi:hypothetical protein